MNDVKWRDAVEKAANYIAVGQTELYLGYKETDFPWEHTTKVEGGCGYRLGIPTGVSFSAKHPCGLTFRWSFDFEDSSANGSGEFKILTDDISDVIGKLPSNVAKQFAAILANTATAVQAKGNEWQEAADRQYQIARELRRAMNKV